MPRPIVIPLIAALLLSIVPPSTRTTAEPGTQIMTYAATDENFPNPERGFYIQRAPLWIDEERIPLERAELDEARAGGIDLIRTYYVLDRHRDRPLDESVFAALRADLATIRAAGFKVILRFAYNFPLDESYVRAIDAPLDLVLTHIDQLAPILRDNVDVIAHMEAGFIGAWGEWHSSSNQLIDHPQFGINEPGRAILFRLLDALPVSRMIAIRYPLVRHQLFGTEPLTEADAFSGTPQARIAAHDDCFLASDINWGTYLGPDTEPQIDFMRAFLHANNRYVVQSGETCNTAEDAQPFIHCAYALPELAYLRWSSINIDYHPDVIALWKAEGCFDAIARRLGYRLRLTQAALTVQPDGLALRLDLVNDGFASPYNPRGFVLALRDAAGQITPLTLETPPDPRRWLPDAPIALDLRAALPPDLPAGMYALVLALPDPEPTLAGDPRYAIRLANPDLWDAATGYHDLGLSVPVGRAP
ncbi:MAG: DUF4832 domain-containing protein [Candidatus Flexifilum sp.]